VSPQLDDAIALLRTLRTVTGSAVGSEFKPGTFFLLSRYFLMVGSIEDYEALTRDDDPMVRAMGMLCMALVAGPDAVPALRQRLGSRVRMDCLPFGCCVEAWHEADLARLLLHDPSFFGHSSDRVPAVEDDLNRIDLRILADDRLYSAVRFRWGSDLAGFIDRPSASEVMAALRNILPDLSDHMLVKVAGRIQPCAATRRFLLACVTDEMLDDASRLAAGSALTRDAHPDALAALESAREVLDGLAKEERWGSRFLESARARKTRQELWDSLGQKATLQDRLDVKRRIVRLPSISDPADCDLLCRWLRDDVTFSNRRDLVEALVASLVSLVSRLDEVAPEWHTYSDVPFRLFDLLTDEVVEERLAPNAWRRLAEAVAPRLPRDLGEMLLGDRGERRARLNTARDDDYVGGLKTEVVGTSIPGYAERLGHTNVEIRREAAARLATAGPAARELSSKLRDAFGDPDATVRHSAAVGLSLLGEGADLVLPYARFAIRLMLEQKEDEDASYDVEPVRMLACYGPEAASTRADLVRLLGVDASHTFLLGVARALFRTGAADLAEARSVLRAVGREDVSPLRPREEIGFSYPDGAVRCAMVRTFAGKVPVVIEALASSEPVVRRGAARVLGALGPCGRDAVGGLVGLLKDEDRGTRLASVRALGAVGPDAHAASGALAGILRGNDRELAVEAARALAAMGPLSREAAPDLAIALENGTFDLRIQAALALREMGKEARAAVPVLKRVLATAPEPLDEDDERARLGRIVASALRRIDPEAGAASGSGAGTPGAAPDETFSESRRGLTRALREAAGEEHAQSETGLRKLVSHSDMDVRFAAAVELSRIAPRGDPEVLAALDYVEREWPNQLETRCLLPARLRVTGWRDEYAWDFLWQIIGVPYPDGDQLILLELLGRSGAPVDAQVPVLELALRDCSPRTRKAAASALGGLGPQARSAIGALRKAVADEDRSVRAAASDALENIEGGRPR
jgi:HEAT repeat protein